MESNILCEQITPQLDAFRDGELNADETAAVEQHLAGCSDCRLKVTAIDRVIETLRTMPRQAMPAGLSAKLDGIVDGAPSTKQNVVPMSRKLWMPVAAAAAVAAIVFGVKFAVPGTTPATVTADATAPQAAPTHQTVTAQQPTAPQPTIAAQPETPPSLLPAPAALGNHKHAAQHEANHVASKLEIANNSEPPHTSRPDNGSKIAAYIPSQNEPRNTTGENATSEHELELAELPSNNSNFADTMGIATDEDGLYDIKM